MAVPKPGGRVPKPTNKRRNTATPRSYGLATVTNGGQAAPQPDQLGFPAHALVKDLWAALATSVEGKFYSHADWERVRMELWFANKVLNTRGRPSATAWGQVQSGLNEMLISPADKRRIGIELKASDDDEEEAAVVQMAAYQEKLAQA